MDVNVNVNLNQKLKVQNLSQRYGKDDLKLFKEIIEKKIELNLKQIALHKSSLKNPNSGDDQGRAASDIEANEHQSKTQILNTIGKLTDFNEDLKNALFRIRNKNYGTCRKTNNLIDRKRLMLVPHATLSVEGKEMRN
jgi:RNA polymerase-binding transcription factor DksA